MPKHLRIATRRSPLALRQAELVQILLQKKHPNLTITIVPITTSGDQLLNHPLATIGGKGLFIKELEQALLEEQADIAVHSMKDVPIFCAGGLEIAAICEREDPRDVFIANDYPHLSLLPQGSILGTASLRRQSLIKRLRPDIFLQTLRGNVNSRLEKLDNQQYHAIVLAAAGLHRLGIINRIKYYFTPEEMLPAVGQGAIGIECRSNDRIVKKILATIDHFPTRICIQTERCVSRTLNASCQVPLAAYATIQGETIFLRSLVADLYGEHILRASHTGSIQEVEKLGEKVAGDLLKQGAGAILESARDDKGQ